MGTRVKPAYDGALRACSFLLACLQFVGQWLQGWRHVIEALLPFRAGHESQNGLVAGRALDVVGIAHAVGDCSLKLFDDVVGNALRYRKTAFRRGYDRGARFLRRWNAGKRRGTLP